VEGGARAARSWQGTVDLLAEIYTVGLDGSVPALKACNGGAQFYKSGLMANGTRDVCHCIRLPCRMRAPWTDAHDDESGSAQMVGEALRREPGREIPAAPPGLATLVVTQRIRERFGDLLRRRGCKVG
jgi:hypothetical protein